MTEILNYAPYILIVIIFGIQCKIFMTPADFEREKARFTEWISINFVNEKTYRDNHIGLENRFTDMDKKIDDIRNLLIAIVQNQNSRN